MKDKMPLWKDTEEAWILQKMKQKIYEWKNGEVIDVFWKICKDNDPKNQ